MTSPAFGGPGPLLLLLLALAVDGLAGESWPVARLLPDPGALAGRYALAMDRRLNRIGRGATTRMVRGAVVVAVGLAVAAVAGWGVTRLAGAMSHGWILEVLAILAAVRFKSSWTAIRRVRRALERGGLAAGRDAVLPLTRRHAFSLDEHGVSRAAVEAAATAADRSLVAPAFWFALLGLPGLFVWRVVGAMAAAIGGPGVRYEWFGQTAGRLDDALDALPARLCAGLLALAAPFVGSASLPGAFAAVAADARKHPSLNGGWPLAAMAGALGLALGGPHRDGGVVVQEPWIGQGRARAVPADIDRALALAAVAGLLTAGLVGSLAAALAAM